MNIEELYLEYLKAYVTEEFNDIEEDDHLRAMSLAKNSVKYNYGLIDFEAFPENMKIIGWKPEDQK
jgi:hypothetical protein